MSRDTRSVLWAFAVSVALAAGSALCGVWIASVYNAVPLGH